MQFRLNIRKVKGLVWLACVGVLALDGLSFWDVYKKKKIDNAYDIPSSAHYEALLRQRIEEDREGARDTAIYDEERRESMWNSLVDGSIREIETERIDTVAEVAPQFTLPDLDQILKVTLIVYSPDMLSRFAAIEYLPGSAVEPAGKERRLHLTEGTLLSAPYGEEPYGGAVESIGLQEVVFMWGGEEVSVAPGLGSDGNAPQLKDFKVLSIENPLAGVDEPPEETLELSPGQFVLGTRHLTELRTNPQRHLIDELGVRPITPSGGGRTVLELAFIPEGSILDELGAEEGDRLISVNGIPMPSVAAAVNWATQNPGVTTYVIEFERAGKIQTMTFHISELADPDKFKELQELAEDLEDG